MAKQAEMDLGKQKEAAYAEKSAAQQLKAMPKVSIIIPDDPQNPGDRVVPIGFNGVVYTVPRGVETEVPEAIAKIWKDSYARTRAVNQRIDDSTKTEVKVM
ncbi:hypothetical protein [Paenibacillus dakarensis]|uniref:hypothetical protein n=1 Tax=Paenibacillus dakarensis TaxID=1527293 RepID=UPI0006D5926B|nr:hypothetical protein [Paenibacillus dakarensis]